MNADELELDMDELVDNLTGRSGGLRPSKPRTADKLTQYIWRMARFHAGYDTSMPVTCTWWLDDYLEDNGYDTSVSGILDDDGKELLRGLDKVTEDVLVEFGECTMGAAKEWKGKAY